MAYFLGLSRKTRWIYLAWIFAPVIIFLLFDQLGLKEVASSGASMESMGDAVAFLILMLVCIIPLISLFLLGWLLSNLIRVQKGLEFFWPLIVGLCTQSIFLGIALLWIDYRSDLFEMFSLWTLLIERSISYLKDPILYLPLIILQMVYFLSAMTLSRIQGVSLTRVHVFSTIILLVFAFFSWSLIPGIIVLY